MAMPRTMDDYRVQLDVYHGPLDLLLYLIRRDEIDIHDIPIAPITEQYLAYVKTMRTLDINLAGEFLVMAATLMEIKSAMISPKAEGEGEPGEAGEGAAELSASEDPTDPRYELIQQLLAYKRFREMAQRLDQQRSDFQARFAIAAAGTPEAGAVEPATREVDLEDVSLWDLVEAFTRIMEQVGHEANHEVIADDTPLELHVADLADRLEREGPMSLQAAFAGRGHGEMVGLFLAMLELARQRRLRIRQEEVGGPIALTLSDPGAERPEAEDGEGEGEGTQAPPDPGDVDAFDWPDDLTRRRYQRRQERRARGEEVEEDAELAEDIAELEARRGPGEDESADEDDEDEDAEGRA